mgnify:FL=1
MPRKSEGLTAEGHKRPKKADISKNGSIDLEELRKRDKGKVSLRIDANTVILVSPENKNEEYAARFRNRIESLR